MHSVWYTRERSKCRISLDPHWCVDDACAQKAHMLISRIHGKVMKTCSIVMCVGAVCCPHDLGKCCIPGDHKLIVHEVYAKKACMYISRIQSKGVKTWRFSIFSTMCNPPLTTGQGLRDGSPYAYQHGEHKETSLLMYDGCRLDHCNAQGASVCMMLVHI
jgi:hypothetical protein